ncbi:hypothetical protein Vi05172_g4865 [Venturia inaequalis]|nr:hypothetical protein Vi05172_g4865 [Venturia inaequalis]
MFNLDSHGDERLERQELGRRLGSAWCQVQGIENSDSDAGADRSCS